MSSAVIDCSALSTAGEQPAVFSFRCSRRVIVSPRVAGGSYDVLLPSVRQTPIGTARKIVARPGGSMSTRTDYSPEEWKAISGAPVAAGMFIVLSDASGPVGLVKEALAVGKAISESAQGTAPDVVKSIAESVKAAKGRPEMP